MLYRSEMICLMFWVMAVLSLGSTTRSNAAERRPNIVVIMADDLGYADVGFQGSHDIPTPRLDALAKSGLQCTNGYVSHPFCSPTRAGLLTGRYQQRFGHENNPAYLPGNDQVGLPLAERTVADLLAAAGYVTGAVGKWHLGAAPCFHPNERGFREYFGLIGGGHDYFQHNLFKTNPGQATAEYRIPLVRQKEPVAEDAYLTDALAREAVDFVTRHRSEPFFLYLAFNAPHTPLQAKPADLERMRGIADEKRRAYAAMIQAMDQGIGQVLDGLAANQIDQDTLVFFLSDNGGPVSVSNCSNAPLRGAKGQVYEGGVRVPFLIRWPGQLPAGRKFDAPVTSLDILPTALAAAQTAIPDAKRLDGVNLLPHLTGELLTPPHEVLYWRTGGGASYAVRQAAFKLVHVDGRDELFDLGQDISESRDLSADKPEIVALLKKSFTDWNAELVAPLWSNPQGAQSRKKKKE